MTAALGVGWGAGRLLPRRPDLRHGQPRDRADAPASLDILADLETRILRRDFSRPPVGRESGLGRTDGGRTDGNCVATCYGAVLEALERAVQKADAVVRSARDGIISFAASDLAILQANPAAEGLFGRPQGGLAGLSITAVIALDEPPPGATSPRPLARLLDGTTRLTWGVRADGSHFPLEITASRLSDEDGDYWTVFLRDVSERIEAQQELRQAQEWQQRILDAIPFPVAVMRRRDELVLYVNQPVAVVANRHADSLVGRRSSVKYVDRQQYDEVHALLESEGRADAREVLLRNGDGRAFWAILSAVRINYKGEDAVLIGFTDITARKETEAAQRELIDAIPVPLVLARTGDFRLLHINRRASELFGIAPHRAVGRLAPDFYVDPADRERLSHLLREEGQVDEFEVQLKDDHGRPFWALLSSRLFDHKGERASLTAVNVINERKRMEEELARERGLLKATLENMDQAMVITDAALRVIGWNHRCVDLLELPAEFLKREPTLYEIAAFVAERGEFDTFDPAEASLFRDDPRTLLETRPIFERRRPNGTVIEVRANRLPGGGFVCTYTDITIRKAAEDELRSAKNAAEQAYARLHQAQDSLLQAEKMAALGSLVAGVAHEINTPIGTALTAASHLSERTREFRAVFEGGKLRKSDAERYIETATEASQIMVATIGRAAELIQSFKQVAVDQSTDVRRRFDLKTYINEVLLSLRPRLKPTPHEVVVDCPDDLAIDSYPGALSQVLTNFVMNSLLHGFTEGQAGTIAIAVTLESEDMVTIRYSDTGRGIPEKYRSRIFEPFFTTKRGSGGTGLGLHIVFNIISQSLGGTIELLSGEGQGAAFIIRIPRTAPGNVDLWIDEE